MMVTTMSTMPNAAETEDSCCQLIYEFLCPQKQLFRMSGQKHVPKVTAGL
jgi:hypothetical protein